MKHTLKFGFTLLILLPALSFSADWPQWRHDATRSGATEEILPDRLEALWEIPLGKSAPAFEYQMRMCADYSYAPVAAGNTLYLPSGVTDQVMAIDLRTGELKWRYVADGPCRFAPIVSQGKLYFVSDDGHLYCLNATNGDLIWKRRGVPEGHPDMRMLVNGRMVSRWPARGAPVLHEGRVYFGSGIWPEEGSYMNAVDAESGALLWQTDSLSIIKEGMCDHGQNLDLSLPPHGYAAVIGNKLAVSSGRTLAAWFDLKTGKMDPYTSFYVKKSNPRGTWYVAGNDRYWVQGGNWFASSPDVIPPRPANTVSPLSYSAKSPASAEFQLEARPYLTADLNSVIAGEVFYSEPVFTRDTAYVADFDDENQHRTLNGDTFVSFRPFDKIIAQDLTQPAWTVSKSFVDMAKSKGKSVSLITFPVKWELKTSMKVLIKTGNHLIVGENKRIAAVRIPEPGEEPAITWEAEIDGVPINTLFANGALVTTTDAGTVYCFGEGARRDAGLPYVAMKENSPANGYACFLGWGDGQDVLALAHNPEWRVVVLEKDAAVVAAARSVLNKRGLYGRRVQVVQSDRDMRLTPYWGSRVQVVDPTTFGSAKQTLTRALDTVRPYNGVLVLDEGVDPAILDGLLSDRTEFQKQGGALVRMSAPEGAADWAQESAEGDNSFISHDKLVKWPLGILWYSGDLDRFITPDTDLTHIRTPYPLVKGGRMFLFTHETLHAVDIYTGSYLWETVLPKTPYLNTRRFLNRLYGKPTDRNYVLADDGIYCITGEKILVYDVTDGSLKKTLVIPEQLRAEANAAASPTLQKKMRDYDESYEIRATPHWTEVRLWKDSIVAKLGNTMVAIDRHSGKTRWSRKGTRGYTVSTVGDGRLYALDCIPDHYSRNEEQVEKVGELFAVDLETGDEVWTQEVAYMSWPKGKSKSIFPWMKPAMPSLGYNAKHELLVMAYNGMSTKVINAADGSERWSKVTPKVKEASWNYSPNILDDQLMMSLSKYQSGMGHMVDILTGEELNPGQVEVPRARTCGRLIGNSNLLSYRDGAVEIYDVQKNLTIPLNSMRTGCTTGFVPAGGVMSAPMLGHGCVCNYPMFASLAMVHMPGADRLRPEAVLDSWGADQRQPPKKAKRTKK